MKLKSLLFVGLLSLTGCGGTDPSAVTPGDQVEKSSFENAFLVRNLLLNSNFHMEVSYSQTEFPGGVMMFSKSVDFAGPKLKVVYNLASLEPFYFDFSRSNDSSSYTLDLYSKDNDEQSTYSVQTFKNIAISNSFMGITDLLPATFGMGLTLVSGLNYSDFEFSNGVYQIKSPIKITNQGTDLTFNSLKVSMSGNNPKKVYYNVTTTIVGAREETFDISADAHMYFSNYGQVTVTLPEVGR